MMKPSAPRILLVEDDPVSAAFLEAAASALPARVEVADGVAPALRLAEEAEFDLWLLDANLADGSGIALLDALRRIDAGPVALAHTADDDPRTRAHLLEAGFVDVIYKPVAAAELRRRLCVALGIDAGLRVGQTASTAGPCHDELPLWDDAAALRALGGNPAHVQALRSLFLGELAQQLQTILDADSVSRHALLHRIQASCGFVGAARLCACVAAVQQAPADARLLQVFSEVAAQTLEAAERAGWQRISVPG